MELKKQETKEIVEILESVKDYIKEFGEDVLYNYKKKPSIKKAVDDYIVKGECPKLRFCETYPASQRATLKLLGAYCVHSGYREYEFFMNFLFTEVIKEKRYLEIFADKTYFQKYVKLYWGKSDEMLNYHKRTGKITCYLFHLINNICNEGVLYSDETVEYMERFCPHASVE